MVKIIETLIQIQVLLFARRVTLENLNFSFLTYKIVKMFTS